jgi:hypothetical protein
MVQSEISEIGALLETHDALMRACLDSRLGFSEFLAAYGDFSGSYALDEWKASVDERIAFHVQAAGVLSGLRSERGSTVYADVERSDEAGRIGAKYPKFEAETSG